jgi:hypothetical protein
VHAGVKVVKEIQKGQWVRTNILVFPYIKKINYILQITTNSQIEEIKMIACNYLINKVQAKPISNIAVNPIPQKSKNLLITPTNNRIIESKLIALKSKFDKGEISQQEYEKQKLVILNSL